MSGRLGYFLWRIFNPQRQMPEKVPLRGQGFAMPDDPLTLHPAAKRVVTICNLFANQNKSIAEIAGLLDTKASLVLSALIKGEVIADRRHSNKRVKQDRRSAPKYHLPLTRETGRSDYSRALCGVVCDETVSEFIFLEVIRSDERCHECLTRHDRCAHSALSFSGLEEGYRH
jgi:hypothetical protein